EVLAVVEAQGEHLALAPQVDHAGLLPMTVDMTLFGGNTRDQAVTPEIGMTTVIGSLEYDDRHGQPERLMMNVIIGVHGIRQPVTHGPQRRLPVPRARLQRTGLSGR